MHLLPGMILVLSIPHVRDEIASSLSPHDLALCCRVCIFWNNCFSSVLWKTLSFNSQRVVSQFQTCPTIQLGLARNADHIRAIHSYFCYAFQSLPETALFQNLIQLSSLASELHNKGIVDHTNTKRLLAFLKVNRSLTEVTLTNFPLASRSTSKLLGEVIARHPGLKRVTINCFRDADLVSIQHVLGGAALSANLEMLSLVCRSHIFWGNETQCLLDADNGDFSEIPYSLLLPEDRTEPLADSRLKELILDFNLERALYVTLLPLLRLCVNLKQLFVPCIDVEQSLQDLCQILEQHCTRLQGLEVGYLNGRDEHQGMLINAVQHLRTFILGSALPLQNRSMEALLHHRHSLTLETLDIRQCTAVESRHLQLLLTSCPNLNSFKAMSAVSRSDIFDPRIDIKDLPIASMKPAWVCRALRVLHIGFSGFLSLLGQGNQGSAQLYVDYIYMQIAALTELRTLHLGGEILFSSTTVAMTTSLTTTTLAATPGIFFPASSLVWAFDLSLESGLGKLAALKELRSLNIQRVRHHRIGRAEAEWIACHWPRLRTFHGPPECWYSVSSSLVTGAEASVGGCSSTRSGITNSSGGGGGSSGSNSSSKSGRYVAELMRCRPQLTVTLSV